MILVPSFLCCRLCLVYYKIKTWNDWKCMVVVVLERKMWKMKLFPLLIEVSANTTFKLSSFHTLSSATAGCIEVNPTSNFLYSSACWERYSLNPLLNEFDLVSFIIVSFIGILYINIGSGIEWTKIDIIVMLLYFLTFENYINKY